MRYNQDPIVVDADMSLSVTSTTIPLDQVFGYSVQAVYTTGGTLAGTLELQASCNHQEDNEKNVIVAGDWVTVKNSPVVLTGAGSYIWNVQDPNYLWARLVYTPDPSDTGTLNATVTTKGF